jgi:hypothetical protein
MANRSSNGWHRGCWADVALLLPIAACGDGAARVGPTIDTLESGVIVASNPSTGVWDEGSAWRLTDETSRATVIQVKDRHRLLEPVTGQLEPI